MTELSNEDGLVKREFIFDTTPQNFKTSLYRSSHNFPGFTHEQLTWETMESNEDIELELMGFYNPDIFRRDKKDIIKIQVSSDSSGQISVAVEYSTGTEKAQKFFEELMATLDVLGRFWLKGDTDSTQESTDENGDYKAEVVKKLIQEGAFDGCGMNRETAIETVDAILWLAKNTDKLTAQAIADKAKYAREHWYNFRKGCIQAGVKKINGINVISVRKNN